jgi:hypothetical protein
LGVIITEGAVVYSDDFNRAALAGGTYTYATTVTAGDGAASVVGTDRLQLSNDGSIAANANGIVYVTTPASSFGSSYNATLNANPGLVTWTFNMQQIRADPAGIGAGSYGVGFVLAASSATLTTANGYAVVLGQSGTIDPIRLVRFTGGFGTLNNIISASTPLDDVGANFLSLQVTYNPVGDLWSLNGRDDGASAFADPTSGTLSSLGSASDVTYTGTSLSSLGVIWSYSTAANQTSQFDNFSVEVVPEAVTWALIVFGGLFGTVQLGQLYRRRIAG